MYILCYNGRRQVSSPSNVHYQINLFYLSHIKDVSTLIQMLWKLLLPYSIPLFHFIQFHNLLNNTFILFYSVLFLSNFRFFPIIINLLFITRKLTEQSIYIIGIKKLSNSLWPFTNNQGSQTVCEVHESSVLSLQVTSRAILTTYSYHNAEMFNWGKVWQIW